jgi:hypothetical protein
LQLDIKSGIINLPGSDNYISGLVEGQGKTTNILKIGEFRINKNGKIYIDD